ncbi:MAG: NAD+ synthase [Candidatus Marinimicrobia bacterium]|nr:NAD+ synthase [Candidatus Neomarinimicrobiota bacterium]
MRLSPQDLVFEKNFISECEQALDAVRRQTEDIVAIVGVIREERGKRYNALAIMQDRKIIDHVYKTHLPAYDVFDEFRYFHPGPDPRPVGVSIRGEECRLGIEICEDLWDEGYDTRVSEILVRRGADILLNASASPYHTGKYRERVSAVSEKVRALKRPFVYVNLCGAQDELIFDGSSFAMDADGRFAACLPPSEEAFACCEFRDGRSPQPVEKRQPGGMEELRAALLLGIRDYFHKSGFQDAVIGLSGGIDSALVAALAAEALGAEHVHTYAMPSRFSSPHSLEDAEQCAKNLGVHYKVISIGEVYETFLKALEKPFSGTAFGVAEENLQARIRGSILMSVANKKHALVLTTGNKTEIALGYCTLYGDMCGALAPVSDLNKLDVYRLARHLNNRGDHELIPEHTIRKRPSAELAEDQYDPFDYNVVSPLVDELLYQEKSIGQLIRETGDPELVHELYDLIQKNEYKRRQAAPGLRVTRKAFGRGRKMPMVNHFRIK